MPKHNHRHTVQRRVSVVMCDSYHTLCLVELITRVQQCVDSDGNMYYLANISALEELAKQRLGGEWRSRGTHETADALQCVGVLCAIISGHKRGRIEWIQDSKLHIEADRKALVANLQVDNEENA